MPRQKMLRLSREPSVLTIPEGYANFFSTSGVNFCAEAKSAAERRANASLGAEIQEGDMVGRTKDENGQKCPLNSGSCMPRSKPSHDACTVDWHQFGHETSPSRRYTPSILLKESGKCAVAVVWKTRSRQHLLRKQTIRKT
jgi:hypothetical protein